MAAYGTLDIYSLTFKFSSFKGQSHPIMFPCASNVNSIFHKAALQGKSTVYFSSTVQQEAIQSALHLQTVLNCMNESYN